MLSVQRWPFLSCGKLCRGGGHTCPNQSRSQGPLRAWTPVSPSELAEVKGIPTPSACGSAQGGLGNRGGRPMPPGRGRATWVPPAPRQGGRELGAGQGLLALASLTAPRQGLLIRRRLDGRRGAPWAAAWKRDEPQRGRRRAGPSPRPPVRSARRLGRAAGAGTPAGSTVSRLTSYHCRCGFPP